MAKTSPSTLRVGILGAGLMGTTHSAAYLGIPGVAVSAVWDTDTVRAAKVAERHGAQVCADRAALLKQVDVVDVCLPTPLHLENVQAAAAAGKAVFCEKPLGRTLAQCDAAISACRAARVPLLVGHVVRFFPEYLALRGALLGGQLGEPAVLRFKRVVCAPGGPGTWYWDFEASGGCVLDTAIHDLDWLLWTLGRPARVYGLGERDARTLRELALLTLTWPDGTLAHIESSWCHDGFYTAFEAAGSEGLLEYSMDDSSPLKVARMGGAAGGGAVVPESPLAKSPYQAELEHFVAVVRDGAVPKISPAEARAAVELALACLEAVAGRKVVELPKGGAKRAASAPRRKKALPAAHPE